MLRTYDPPSQRYARSHAAAASQGVSKRGVLNIWSSRPPGQDGLKGVPVFSECCLHLSFKVHFHPELECVGTHQNRIM